MQRHTTMPDRQVAENLRRELESWKRKERQREGKAPSQQEIGHRLGMTQGAVSQYLNAKIHIGTDALLKWSNLLNIPPQKIDPAFTYTAENAGLYNTERAGIELTTVPLIAWSAITERPRKTKGSRAPGVTEEQVAVTTQVGQNAYALRVKGDSMEPKFPEGAIIVVDPDVSAEHNKYVVAQTDDHRDPTFKQLIIDGGKRYLKPLNSRYPIEELPPNAMICGVVRQMLMDFE